MFFRKKEKTMQAVAIPTATSFDNMLYSLSEKVTDSANARMLRLFKLLEMGANADGDKASIGFVCAVNNLERMQKTHCFGKSVN